MIKLDSIKEFPTIISYSSKPKESIVYDTYWKFTAKRQEVFFNRLNTSLPPWTDDPILKTYKFTNAYRAADRVSQYLIKEVIYKGDQTPSELFFRIILFKIFNKIETWRFLEKKLGKIKFSEYNFSRYNKILNECKLRNGAIYSAAYIMASGKSAYGKESKHQNHLKLIEEMMQNSLPNKIQCAKSMEHLYNLLKKYPGIGSFLAYQLATDLNYSILTNFSEMDYVKAGPGAIDGIKKCFISLGDYTVDDTIKMMTERQEIEFERLELNFKTLFGRALQLIDCQNLFCEVDKYSRVAHPEIDGVSGRKRIKQKFQPSSLKPIDYFFPPKWELNHRLLNQNLDNYG
jgi:hypothetical protein